MGNGAVGFKENMIQAAQQGDQDLVIDIKMNAEIGEGLAIAASTGMRISGP
ncbi:hypothetical protein D3C71_2049530 [compost metagenome]